MIDDSKVIGPKLIDWRRILDCIIISKINIRWPGFAKIFLLNQVLIIFVNVLRLIIG